MLSSSIEEGLVVLVAGEPVTVAQCLPKSVVEVVRFRDKKKLRVSVDQISLIPKLDAQGKEAFPRSSLPMESVTLSELKIAEERFTVLTQYMRGGTDLKKAISVLNLSSSRFYQLLKLYDEESGAHSLLRRKRGVKKGGKKLSVFVENEIQNNMVRRRTGEKFTYKSVWFDINIRCLENGEKPPSIGSVMSRFKEMNARQLHALKFGVESAEQIYGAKPGSRKTSRPLEVVQIDHTLVDVILCDQESREPIGRPWLTVLIDTHTRVVLGYYIGFNSPSAISVANAISHAVFPKQEYCKNIGLDAELYPFYGLPQVLHMDNAKEFRSPKLERACSLYRIKTEYRPPGKKHYGGHVERLIGTLMTSNVHFLSGTTFSNVKQRKGYDSESKSALSLREFVKWFGGQVILYHASIHKALGRTPGDAWSSEFFDSAGVMTMPPLLQDPMSFKIEFMPEEIRSISPRGISLHGKRYWSPGLTHFVGLKRALVKYDPLSLAKVWVKLDGEYVAASYTDLTISDLSYEDYLLGRKNKNKIDWVSPAKISSIYKANNSLTKQSKALTKRTRKASAAKKEYLNYLEDLGCEGVQERQQKTLLTEKINYAEKPSSFKSEEF